MLFRSSAVSTCQMVNQRAIMSGDTSRETARSTVSRGSGPAWDGVPGIGTDAHTHLRSTQLTRSDRRHRKRTVRLYMVALYANRYMHSVRVRRRRRRQLSSLCRRMDPCREASRSRASYEMRTPWMFARRRREVHHVEPRQLRKASRDQHREMSRTEAITLAAQR